MDNTSLPVKFSQRAISWLIISTLVWQPMAPAVAAAISPAGPASMDSAANGVPVLNIATPNGAGISHNQFKDYNVGKEGLILNNATDRLNQTQLGGIIQNNPNLHAGQEARGIINEVTGGSRSQLQGYTEVAGKAASVMVANPWGITCDGCGFINTPNATLTTGKPQFDDKGNLSALNVTGGTITVQGKGLDASQSDALSIIARATEVNAAIHAKDLTVTAGANRVGADGSVAAIEGEGAAPTVAVDTGALGGMYANRIHLVSSDKGVGVNLGNLSARQGDITLDASGKLVLNNSLSGGALAVKGDSVSLSGSHKAGGDIAVTAAQDVALNNATLAAEGKLTLRGNGNTTLNDSRIAGGTDLVISGKQIGADATSQASATRHATLEAKTLHWQGGLSAGGDGRITADNLDNSGTVTAKGQLTTTTDSLKNSGTLQGQTLEVNSQTAQNSGTLTSAGDTRITAGQLDNQGTAAAKGNLTASTSTLTNSGMLQGEALGISGESVQNSGTLLSAAQMHITAGQLDNRGSVAAKGGLTASTTTLNNSGTLQGQTLAATGDVVENSGTLAAGDALDVRAGTLTTGTDSVITAKGGVTLSAKTTADLGGQVNADNALTVKAGDLQTRQNAQLQSGSDMTLTGSRSITLNGTQAAKGALGVTAKTLSHGGKSSSASIALTAPESITNSGTLVAHALNLSSAQITNGGLLQGTRSLSLQTGLLDNLSGGTLYSANALTLAIPTLNNGGLITTDGDLFLHGDVLTNDGELNGVNLFSDYRNLSNNGRLLADGQLTLAADSIHSAGLVAANTTAVTADTLDNAGTLQGDDALTLQTQNITNSGTLAGGNTLDLSGQALMNNGLLAAKNLTLNSKDITNGGTLQGTDLLTASGTTLTNQQGSLLLSNGLLTLDNQRLENAGQLQGDTLNLATGEWINSGTVLAEKDLTATVGGALDNEGRIVSQQALALQADRLSNSGALLAKVLDFQGDLSNSGLVQGSDRLGLKTRNLINAATGKVFSGSGLELAPDRLDNQGQFQVEGQLTLTGTTLVNGGTLDAQALDIDLSGALDNQGVLLADNAARLRSATLTNGGDIAGKTLDLGAGEIHNSGLIQGARQAQATAGEITNTADGKWLSGGELALSAERLNNAGTVQGDTLRLTGTALDNQGVINGIRGLTGVFSDRLDNQGQMIGGGVTDLQAASLISSGRISGDTLTLTASSLENRGLWQGDKGLSLSGDSLLTGELARTLSGGQLTLSAGQLTTGGTLQGNQVSVDAGDWILNGSLLSKGDFTGRIGHTLNLPGLLVSQGGMDILAQTVNNDGQILSAGDATLGRQTLSNTGTLQGKTLTAHQGTITNSGALIGLDGLILDGPPAPAARPLSMARTGVAVTPGLALSNGATGKLLTQGQLAIDAGSLDNQGRLEAGELTLTAGTLSNHSGGEMIGRSEVTLTTSALLNGGLIQGDGDARIDAADEARNDGKMLFRKSLTLTTPDYAGAGWLQATRLLLDAGRNGSSGTLVADEIALTGDTLDHQGTTQANQLTLNYREIGNGGALIGNDRLTVTAGQIVQSADGKLFSGGDLSVGATGVNALGQVVALGDLTLQLTDTLLGQARYAAGKTLTITGGGAIENQGVMQGQTVSLQAGGALINGGEIATGSGDSRLSGSEIVLNDGSTLQGGGDLTLASTGNITTHGFAGTLGNLTLSTPGSIVNTALLYAAKNLALYSASLQNQRGELLAGNNLAIQRDAAGSASDEVRNVSGTIETQSGDITIKTGHLLNTREGLTTTSSTEDNPQEIAGLGNARISVHVSKMPARSYGIGIKPASERCRGSATKDDHCTTIPQSAYYAPLKEYNVSEFATSKTVTTVNATGGSALIQAGKNAYLTADNLENNASNILVNKDISLDGGILDNHSWQNATTSSNLTYTFKRVDIPDYQYSSPATVPVEDLKSIPLYPGSEYINFQLTGNNTKTELGEIYRSVIQAGGNITADFSRDISNTLTAANAGGLGGTLNAPALNTLGIQPLTDGVAKQTLADQPIALRDQMQDAIRQINGGLDATSLSDIGLRPVAGGQKDSGASQHGGITPAALKPGAGVEHAGQSVDTSAYPLPEGSGGYFVVTDNPKSPYLITVNPSLDGLGQLDPALFGDLYKLTGIAPSAAPRETRPSMTDEKQFLGSAYMLGRLNLSPEHDYRFLGDAAFDTRYVTNRVLNQTGNRYLAGVGSDLEQMRYLMDNAASAQSSLGLEFGVSLTADQVAGLDRSILWWESATVNGETVMIPKVYLSPKDITVNNGSVIAASNVAITGGNVASDGSTLLAKNALAIDSAGEINNVNSAQISAGGNLDLHASGDINNISATIAGRAVDLESLDGSINNLTLAEQFSLDAPGRFGSVALKDTLTGRTATIASTEGLALAAGKDISLTGAALKAGGDLLMDAGGNITANAIETNKAYAQSGFWQRAATSRADISQTGSSIQAGAGLAMLAGNDLTLSASDVSAGKSAQLAAGQDLTLKAQQTAQNSRSGGSESHATGVEGATVTAGGNLTLTAGRDLTSQAAALAAGEQAGLQAGRDVNLLAEATTWGNSSREKKHTVINEHVRQQGTEITSGGDTLIVAGRDVTAQASQVMAQEDIGVQAGRDVTLTTATESDYYYEEKTKTKKGFLKKTTTHTITEQFATREAGSLLSGDSVTVKSGNDILVKGSAVAGDRDVALDAQRHIDVAAATNTSTSWHMSETKKSGLMGSGGIGFTIGTSKTKQDLREKGTTQSQSMSTVGSTGGSVALSAGEQVHIGAADLVAKNNISLAGDSLVIEAGQDKHISDQTFEQKSSGLTLALSGAVGDVVNTAVSTAVEAKSQSDGRLAALQATKAVLSGVQAGQASRLAEAASGGDMTKNGAFGVMVSLGGQSSKSTSHSEQITAIASTLNAGNNLDVTANGKGSSANSGDIAVSGSQVKAGKDIALDAARDITLDAAANTQFTTGSNSSKGGSLGVGITAGPNGAGFTVSASANAAKGGEKGNGTEWSETTLDAGGNLSLTSGRDALLQGAQVNGDKVTADIGRDLTLSSLQDSNDYNSKQQSLSGGLSYTFGAGGGPGANISYSRDKIKSNYDSVQEQTGIFAGKGGFDITVGNHSQLDGAVIASRAEADKNRLETGTLGFTDISNKADYKVEHQGGGFSTSGGIAGNVIGNMASTMLTGLGGSGHAEGTTQSAVADGAIIINDSAHQQQDVGTLSRDTEHANGSIDPIFNKEKEQRRLQTAQLLGEIGRQVSDIVRTDAKIRATENANAWMEKATPADRAAAIKTLEKDKKAVTEEAISGQMYQTFYNDAFAKTEQGTGGQYQRAITAATAAIQAIVGGDIKGALAGAAAPYIANEIAKAIPEKDRPGRVLAHAIVNAALAAASGKDAGTAAAGAATGELAGMIALDAWDKTVDQLSEEEKQTVSALATLASGLAGGLVGDSGANAVAGAQAGKTVVENNAMSDIAENLHSGISQAEKYQKAQDALVKATEEFKAQNCAGLSAEACSTKMAAHRDELLTGSAEFGSDFIPVYGDLKSFVEAQSALDYLLAAIGVFPPAKGISKLVHGAEVALKKGDLAEASKLINKASDEIVAASGSKGNWSKELNNPQPNKTYQLDGNKTFKTDSLGRTESVESSLSWSKNDRNTYQQCKTGKCGVDGDEGGHLIASIFNGPGEKLNLVPMDGKLNKGIWKQMENDWARALKDGKQVNVKIEPSYKGDSLRPESFNVTYSIDGGRPVFKDIANTPGGKR